MPFDLSKFGAQAANDDTNVNASVSVKDLETSLVKGLGELFTREDKKNSRVFRGKPSDPPITTWLKEAEITAYLNEWDDEQKFRYFSDRLKDEAAEWFREYIENEGDVSYSVWKDALISRFRNQADVECSTIFTDQQRKREESLVIAVATSGISQIVALEFVRIVKSPTPLLQTMPLALKYTPWKKGLCGSARTWPAVVQLCELWLQITCCHCSLHLYTKSGISR